MYKIVEFSKVLMEDFIKSLNKNNIICIDATLGNGFDSLFLSKLIKNNGIIYAYDIQEESINNSTKLFKENNVSNVIMKLKSHEFIDEENIDLAIFNLGYLPGSNKEIKTNATSTLNAIKNLIPRMNKENMLIIICLYIGHNEGLYESIVLDEYLKNLPAKEYLICKYQNYNRPTSPYILTISLNKLKK